MNIIIHRGTHEIGGSCVELQSNNSKIIIDIGMPLVKNNGEKFNINEFNNLSDEELVSNKVLPDIKGLYKWDKQNDKVDGVLISHPHMDHFAYDSYAFLIEAEGKKVIYSGDFRAHGRKAKAFRYFLKIAPKNIDALILEGTMFGRQNEEVKTEQQIESEIDDLVKKNEGITLMNFSAQNIDRVVTMYRVAKRNRKIFVIDFYAANILSLLSETIPHPSDKLSNIKVFFPTRLSEKTANEGHRDLMLKSGKYKMTKRQINDCSKDIMMLVRNSMINDLKYINAKKGLFIYSMWCGYLKEKSMKTMLSLVNNKEMKFQCVHTSGHASIDTLNKVVNVIEPKVILPIHSFHTEKYKLISSNIYELSDGEAYTV